MTGKYLCNIIVSKHNNISWNINFIPYYLYLKDEINKFQIDKEIVKIKSTSICINCKTNPEQIKWINEYVIYCKNEIANKMEQYIDEEKSINVLNNVDYLNYDYDYGYQVDMKKYLIITLEINDGEYFLEESNILEFNFIECIIIGKEFKKNIGVKFNLFKGLKKVILNIDPSEQLISSLPDNLDKLKYYDKSTSLIEKLPLNLNTLVLGRFFNSQINLLESNLVSIVFPNIFSQPVDNLAPSIQVIKFGICFNHPVDNLPWSTREIYFGRKFNQPVDSLPSSLKMISFDHDFNQSVDNLPYGLEMIIIKSSHVEYCKFTQTLDNLPNSVKHIVLLNERYNRVINKFPKSLKKITISTKYAYTKNQLTKNTNKFDITNGLKKQTIECEILID